MQLHSAQPFQPRPFLKETIPYSSAARRQDLDRLRGIWDDCLANRDRNAIYGYLNALRPGGLVVGGGQGNRPGLPGSALVAVGSVCSD
jgi:hypothetical protein